MFPAEAERQEKSKARKTVVRKNGEKKPEKNPLLDLYELMAKMNASDIVTAKISMDGDGINFEMMANIEISNGSPEGILTRLQEILQGVGLSLNAKEEDS